MKKKVLFTATVDSHILNFHIPYLKYFHDQGYEVHVATNGNEEIPYCDKKIVIPFERSPFKLNNLKSIKLLKKVIMEEKYDIIHTHTPMGSVVTRLAAAKARKKYHTRVIYTAHGFHFYKGAPKLNWILFYPVEKILSRITDTLITINSEDYNLAKKKFHCKDIQYVPGVGIDENKFNIKMTKKEKLDLRKSLGLKEDDFVMIYVARLDKNKNQGFLIDMTRELIKTNPKAHLLLVGPDEFSGKYQEQAKDISSNVHLTGLRKDIPELLKISNVAVSSSLREGLPVNIMEALTVGLPVVALDTRGVRDLVKDGDNGFIINNLNISAFTNTILNIINNKLRINYKKTVKPYLLSNVLSKTEKIYCINNEIILSIVVPVYNVKDYLEECYNSIYNSKYSKLYEIILVDDGSTDGTSKLCDRFKKNENTIVFHKKNGGLSSARNYGLERTSGKYVTFIDSDDKINKESIPIILDYLLKNTTELIFMNAYKYYENDDIIDMRENIKAKKINKSKKKAIKYLSSRNKYPVASWSKIYLKSLLINHEISFPSDRRIAEDMGFTFKCILHARSYDKLEVPYYYYRQNRSGSLTSKKSFERFNGLKLFIIESAKNYSSNHIPNNRILKYLFSYVAYEYCILLWLYSTQEISEKKESINVLYNYKWVLKYSRTFKTIFIRLLLNIFGIEKTSKIIKSLKG